MFLRGHSLKVSKRSIVQLDTTNKSVGLLSLAALIWVIGLVSETLNKFNWAELPAVIP